MRASSQDKLRIGAKTSRIYSGSKVIKNQNMFNIPSLGIIYAQYRISRNFIWSITKRTKIGLITHAREQDQQLIPRN